MKVKIQQFLAQNHSWSVVGWNIASSLINKGHDVHLFPTDFEKVRTSCLPKDLEPHVRKQADTNYDMQLSYTAFRNFSQYFLHGNKNRFGIWNYEFTKLPPGFAKAFTHVDYILPSSNFAKEIFKNNGIPEDKMVMIPHGVEFDKFKNAKPWPLKTDKKYKILANIAQPHIRKNLPGLLNAFGQAFTKKDDVCLVLKVRDKPAKQQFEVSFRDIYNNFLNKYKNHAECEVITEFIPAIEDLYVAVDVVFTMTYAEAFYLPGLEGLASNNIIISPRYGGQLDYLNDNNSLLIDGKIIRAPRKAQYWQPNAKSAMFEPDVTQAAEKLRYCIDNYEGLHKKLMSNVSEDIYKNHTWDNVVDKILGLCT